MVEKDTSVSKGILETLRKEIKQLPDLITQYVKRTVEIVEDTVVVRCSGLDTLEDKVASLFTGSVVKRLIVKEVVKTVSESALLRTKVKKKEQWYQKIAFKKIKDKVYGMELHYTVIGDHTLGELALIIAYKFVVKIMEDFEGFSTHKARSTPPWLSRYKMAMQDQHGHESPLSDSSHETQSDTSWMTQYEKAIERQGSVSLNIIRCVLVGPPKVGKSCLKHLLVHNEPQEVTTSTPVLESPEVITFTPELYMTHQGSSSVWQPINADEMGGMIKKCTIEEEYEVQKREPHVPIRTIALRHWKSAIVSQLSGVVNTFNPVVISSKIKERSSNPTPSGTVKDATSNSNVECTFKPESLEMAKRHLFRNLSSTSCNTVSSFDQRQLTLIHILDSGGQLAFQDTLPLLIGTPCTYISVFNASVDLDKPIDITFRAQDGSEAKLDHQLSQWDMMLRTFSSVHTMEYKCHEGIRQILQDGAALPHSRIAVVGTHKDQLETLPNQDDLKKKITTLLRGIEGSKPYRILYGQINHPFFLIDNQEGLDTAYVNSLRKTLSSEESALRLKIPVMWLLVELITQKRDSKFIRYDELKQFCLQEKFIDREDADRQFNSLVMLLHSLGFYAFYKLEGVSEADNWVCTDAATLYREVSKLLVIQYMNPNKEATCLFKKSGLISKGCHKELFTEVHISDEMNDTWFLQVIQHIGVAAQITRSNPEKLFVPLALPFNRVSLPKHTTVSNLCFTLIFRGSQSHDLPRGIFSRLVVYLADKRTLLQRLFGFHEHYIWEIEPEHSDRTTIKFTCNNATVYLLEKPEHVEVSIFTSQAFFTSPFNPHNAQNISALYEFCQKVQTTVEEALKYTCRQVFGNKWFKKAEIKKGFLCSCTASPQHLAIVQLKPRICTKCPLGNTHTVKEMCFDEKIWFSKSTQSDYQILIVGEGSDEFCVLDDHRLATGIDPVPTNEGSHPSTLKSKPNESEMLDHLGKDMSADWEMFAVHLNIDPGVQDQVKEDCHRISKRCLLQVVNRWLQEEEGTGDLPRTWSTVVSAVEKCGYGDLAARLRDMYLQPSSTTFTVDESGKYRVMGEDKTTLSSRKVSSQQDSQETPSDVAQPKHSVARMSHSTSQTSTCVGDTSLEESAPFDQKTFMDKYRDRFMGYVPAEDVVSKWEVFCIIDENTLDKVEKAPPSDKRAILFRYIRKNGSLQTIRKMSDFLIEIGEHGYPHVKSLGEDMREDLDNYS